MMWPSLQNGINLPSDNRKTDLIILTVSISFKSIFLPFLSGHPIQKQKSLEWCDIPCKMADM